MLMASEVDARIEKKNHTQKCYVYPGRAQSTADIKYGQTLKTNSAILSKTLVEGCVVS